MRDAEQRGLLVEHRLHEHLQHLRLELLQSKLMRAARALGHPSHLVDCELRGQLAEVEHLTARAALNSEPE